VRLNFHDGAVFSVPRLLCVSWFCLLAGVSAAGEASTISSLLANGRPGAVLEALPDQGRTRTERLAWAAARIGAQPVTDGNLREAGQVLAELARGDDEIGAEAAYLRARIFQVHALTPDYAQAANLFRELAERQPHSHWAQLGLVKLAMLELYVLPASAAGTDRIAAAEGWLARIEEPRLRRDLQLQIGQAGIALREPVARFLPHLVAAARADGITGTAHEDLLVQVGVLSERIGAWAQAREFFERYLAEYPTNVRAFAVREKLDRARRELTKEGRP